ncbi:hypothetical protein TNCV_475621 [Trichonephila clavipes]|nr:hypothetical protein TNCV_475621 [Trichonephila clavipes]
MNLFSLCSTVRSMGINREHNFLKLRSSATILYTANRETSGNSNESVIGYRESPVLTNLSILRHGRLLSHLETF